MRPARIITVSRGARMGREVQHSPPSDTSLDVAWRVRRNSTPHRSTRHRVEHCSGRAPSLPLTLCRALPRSARTRRNNKAFWPGHSYSPGQPQCRGRGGAQQQQQQPVKTVTHLAAGRGSNNNIESKQLYTWPPATLARGVACGLPAVGWAGRRTPAGQAGADPGQGEQVDSSRSPS